MKSVISVLLVMFLFNGLSGYGQEKYCQIVNEATGPGESVTYVVSYSLLLFWTEVGEVTFRVEQVSYDGKPSLHIIASGSTYTFWDWFFKVRDTYQTWTDPTTLLPYAYKRDVYEGGWEIDISYLFDREKKMAYTTLEKTRKPLTRDTLSIPDCTYDVLSIVYYARNLDYSVYQPGDTIPVIILLDNEITPVYFRYIGKESIRVPRKGKFNCIKFSVYLVEGTLFKGGEDMFIWVTDDKNRIPLKITSPILVGSVRARLKEYKGLRHQLSSKIR
ncbi:MAG: DUF3108 domain-containing protein [Bacteroidales bacterium]|nr:MAG: DUF3108 domain-containing protein [Bacteroidales bacterium]